MIEEPVVKQKNKNKNQQNDQIEQLEDNVQMLSTACGNHRFKHLDDMYVLRESIKTLVGAVSHLAGQSEESEDGDEVEIYNTIAEQSANENIDQSRLQPAAVITKKTISKQTADRVQRRRQD